MADVAAPLAATPASDMAPSGWTVERPATPEGAVALVGHETVLATDGKVGRVDGVLVDRASGRVTHLVLREGHLFGHREVQVPAAMDRPPWAEMAMGGMATR